MEKKPGATTEKNTDHIDYIDHNKTEIKIDSLSDYFEAITKFGRNIPEGFALYRGQANAAWDLHSSAYRHREKTNPDNFKKEPVSSLREYHRDLLKRAQNWGWDNSQNLSDLGLLAHLQHQGSPTFLLDFTLNALLALWFACQTSGEKKEEKEKTKVETDGKVFCLDTTDIETFFFLETDKAENLSEEEVLHFSFLPPPGESSKEKSHSSKSFFRYVRWTPPRHSHKRIFAQDSLFLFSREGQVQENDIRRILTIPAGSKKKLLKELKDIAHLTAKNIFPDLPGFVQYARPEEDWEPYLSQGLRYHQQKKREPALSFYKKATDILKETDKKNLILSRIYGNQALLYFHEDPDQAEAYFQKALKIDPNDADRLGNYATFLRKIRGKHDEAEELYKKALDINPNDANNLGNYALFLIEIRKKHDKAEELYRKALHINPNHANNLGNYARFLTEIRKKHDKAEKHYQKALKINPNHAHNLGNYARFLNNIREDYDKAEEYYQKALEINPNDANNLGDYANFLWQAKNDYDKAEKHYQKALNINPNHAIHLGNYALFLAEIRKKYDKAEKHYQKALKINPNDAHNLGNYANFLWLVKKDYPTAEKYYQRVFALAPADPDWTAVYAQFQKARDNNCS